jgi:hypothetical protein
MIRNLDKYQEHSKCIDNTYLYYPIILHNNIVIDGMHRLAK